VGEHVGAGAPGILEGVGQDGHGGEVAEGQRVKLVITNGDVLQASTQVLSVFIDGRPYEPTSKQTRLYDKYRKRLTEALPGAAAPAGGARP
jgi:hypothetical protein